MAIRFGNPAIRYRVGDVVLCQRIGKRRSFIGTVVAALHGAGGRFYHVRDDAGIDWHRVGSEMRPGDAAQNRTVHQCAS